MKAAQYTAPGQVDLVDVAEPTGASGRAVVRTEKVTICGSDLHLLHDSPPDTYPLAPGQSGHECVGVIEDPAATGLRRGDRMLVIPPEFNAFAEYVAMEPGMMIPLPEAMEPEHGLLGQQLGTVIFCCRKLENVLDKTVAVIGQGPAGLFFTALLHRLGARQVIGLDVVDHRLAVARRMGAAHAFNTDHVDPVEAIAAVNEGRMADVVVEAVGKAETVNLCAELVDHHGEVALFGVPKQALLPVALDRFLRRNARIVTSVNTQGEPGLSSFRLAVRMIAEGRLDVSPLITHRLPFARIQKAFTLAETKQDGAVKVLLDFD